MGRVSIAAERSQGIREQTREEWKPGDAEAIPNTDIRQPRERSSGNIGIPWRGRPRKWVPNCRTYI